jgi:two-component system response regulator DevR
MIVDDHEVVRFGLRNLLDRQTDWEVITEASTIAEAIEQAEEHKPDIIVMDIRLNDGSGIDACREIVQKQPNIKVIMLTSFAEDELLFNAISAGAVGYVLKQVGTDDLVRAIDTVARGEALLDSSVSRVRYLAKLRHATRVEAFAGLTEQELKVLSLIARGSTNKEIATSLHLGEGTVRNYVSSIFGKLGLSNRAEATAYAVRHNLDDYVKNLD